ncbi:hypothetical protein TNCV_2137361 [Trichonephila clavipes]|nr:hypothetical protein TNCV_2137361 [Trichonephila clavipes]
MIGYAWDSRNKYIFHRQSQYNGDMTCVCSGQATFRTRVFGFPVDDPLARVIPTFIILSIALIRRERVLWSTFNYYARCSCIWSSSSSSNACNSASSNFFAGSVTLLVSHIEITILKLFKPPVALRTAQRVATVCFYKHLM